ncbi:HNH endonuclease [Mycobacterium sp. 050128]|uniref:HNH endonuclease n=1 Tax=Mycobacterium sp. 050128 TaxID=3096112 RepID=UPI002ED86122
MVAAVSEDTVRALAIEWVHQRSLGGTVPISRDALANDFHIGDTRFPLIDRGRGIRKPSGWSTALSILTVFPKGGVRPYEDSTGTDGLHRYKLRRDQLGTTENESLRNAVRLGAPLIWFVGVAPGQFNVVAPVFLLAEEQSEAQFVMALTAEQLGVDVDSPMESALRRYLLAETKRRLHQPVFASQVMLAYESRCAVCNLHHRELLDAAHIVPDSVAGPMGEPVIANGLALCKIHHAAYDNNILAIRPDLVVEIRDRLLDEIDGPMLRHGLQHHHGRRLMKLPAKRTERPDPRRLAFRYRQFTVA